MRATLLDTIASTKGHLALQNTIFLDSRTRMFIHMLDPTRIAILSVALGFLVSPAISQQPATPHAPAQSGAGSGFTQPDPIDFDDQRGWQSMYDGKSLNGWDGDKTFWRVEDGAIVAESTCEKPTGTIYLIWQGEEPADFEMKLEMKGEGAAVNSGVQYRGAITDSNRPRAGGRPPQTGFAQAGRLAGLHPPSPPRRSGTCSAHSSTSMDATCSRASSMSRPPGVGLLPGGAKWSGPKKGKHTRLLATLGDKDELAGYVHIEGWNQLHLIARGNTTTHIVNGHVMAILIDDDPTKFRKNGLIGFEDWSTGKIAIRNVWLKKL